MADLATVTSPRRLSLSQDHQFQNDRRSFSMIDDLLQELGFSPSKYVKGRSSIADLFKPDNRCGIYVLHFGNSEFYAGKATDISRRYIQHCIVYKDIERISFRTVAREDLDQVERRVIWELEQNGLLLRNVVFTAILRGETDFDLVMPLDAQAEWLNSPHIHDFQGERLEAPDLRRKFKTRYEKFSRDNYAYDVTESLKAYITAGIPVPRRSEVVFWALSCGPRTGEVFSRKSTGANIPLVGWQNQKVYSRLNVNWQEVFTAFTYNKELWFSLHLARSPLENAFGKNFSQLFWKYPGIDHTDHRYVPGGRDQTSFDIPLVSLRPFLGETSVISAIRTLNLRLMKKGTCAFGRFHCMDLADVVLPEPAV